jgi:hypothetical protein
MKHKSEMKHWRFDVWLGDEDDGCRCQHWDGRQRGWKGSEREKGNILGNILI